MSPARSRIACAASAIAAEVLVIDGNLELVERRVQLVDDLVRHAAHDPLPRVVDGEVVGADALEILRAGVDDELRAPQTDAVEVDLRDRPVAQGQVVDEPRDVDRRLGRRLLVTVRGRGRQRVDAVGQERTEQRGDLRVSEIADGRAEVSRELLDQCEVAVDRGLHRCGGALRRRGQRVRLGSGGRVGRDGHGKGLDLAIGRGVELAVAGRELLRLGRPVGVMLLDDDPALDGAERPVERLAGRLDDDLLEDEPGDVLGPIDVADLRIGGHDHRARAVDPRVPRAGGIDDGSIGEVEDGLAQVPDRSVIGLGVEVVGDLLHAPIEEGVVLRDDGLDLLALPLDHLGPRQDRDLRAERLVLDRADEQVRGLQRDREERIRDLRRVGERRHREVDPVSEVRDLDAAHARLRDLRRAARRR